MGEALRRLCHARCWVGKRHLELATKKHADRIDFKVKWLPFQLNPHMREEGRLLEDHYREKFGERGAAMARNPGETRFAKAGAPLGLKFDGVKKTVNTKRSHILLEWAAGKGLDKQNSLAEVLFRYHFAEGKDLNDAGVLVDAAKEVELDGSEARAALEDRDVIGKVDAMLMASTNVKRISGVPHFQISTPNSRTFELSGAQPPDVFSSVFEGLLSSEKPSGQL